MLAAASQRSKDRKSVAAAYCSGGRIPSERSSGR